MLVGSHVSTANGQRRHGIQRLVVPIREQPDVWAADHHGQDSWIGDRTVVLATVGRHGVIGFGAVFTKPIPDYAIAIGVPARAIPTRNATDEVTRSDRLSTVQCPRMPWTTTNAFSGNESLESPQHRQGEGSFHAEHQTDREATKPIRGKTVLARNAPWPDRGRFPFHGGGLAAVASH